MNKTQSLTSGAMAAAVLILISLVIQWLPYHAMLTYNSAQLGESIWTLVSAPLVHLDWNHWLFNMAGLALIVGIFNDQFDMRQLFNNYLLISVVSGGLLWLWPETIEYVGLSGVLHGLLLVCLVNAAIKQPWYAAVIVILLGKVIAELAGFRPDHFVGPDVALIHAAGMIAGGVTWFLQRRRLADAVNRQKTQQD
ncbi:rhombosortase [Idiomarina sp. MD25a]|uniref:rhombosortase n=1 Tax=Idiomarina sp. MD25a TaxID=1889913 RepID=UPI0008F8D6BF|nr:rhombosortase [Idiomarina sp. MD25a]OIN01459.1 rhombosortase [Idiomarina sp. MD25a]